MSMGQAMWTDSGITRHLPLPNSTIGAAPLVTFLFTMAFEVLWAVGSLGLGFVRYTYFGCAPSSTIQPNNCLSGK